MKKLKIEYALGFLFDEWARTFSDGLGDGTVALITKNRPDWQAGKMNGIGGHIEKGENPQEAMVREFEEETRVKFEDWDYKIRYEGEDFVLHIFSGFSTDNWKIQTKTDEDVSIEDLALLPDNIIYNLNWMIPLLLDPHVKTSTIYHVGKL